MIDRQPVTFANCQGYRLHGILENPPAGTENGITIVMLSPGVKMRVAPHRLYNKMALPFLDMGFRILRFDFFGLGDSEGEVEEVLLADLYSGVQVGRYVDDTLCALNWLEKNTGATRFILAGLCGGAITGLLAGKSDPRVIGLLGLGIPVILDSSIADKNKYITAGQLDKLGKSYIRRLFSPKSWFRLLSLQSDYRVIGKVLMQRLRGNSRTGSGTDSSDQTSQDDNTNPLFAPALFEMLANGKRILFVFSGSDRLQWEYEEKFASHHRTRLEKVSGHDLEIHTIAEANHILSLSQWQHEMLSLCGHWLTTFTQRAG